MIPRPRFWEASTTSSFLVPAWTICSHRKSCHCLSMCIVAYRSRFCAVEALASHVEDPSLLDLEGNVNCIALFNHEEIGSVSTTGAESSLIPSLLERLSPSPALHSQSVARSFLVSADMGHAVHPNYTSKYQENHQPQINGGMIVKTNATQRYASDAVSTFLFKKLVERKGGKVQEFEVRNDM